MSPMMNKERRCTAKDGEWIMPHIGHADDVGARTSPHIEHGVGRPQIIPFIIAIVCCSLE
jgi:hypothetical protein